ncbi:short-chain fatty acyl-CoA regulator family protein [Ancylobacter sp. A5.8]|uniref:helix-turn-helix domain-containing protein n=1 Tax=Ancylobacter gelatini TaxID=2919920 RepID=UPI001F4E8A73|nr:short-chain fatty acyl-CoA regulator family protein [Ancylobacter gelatini]MCJ8144558.1 short-chain fatty acyl-CoA regulator family protein [Ancylobacter gelatini]
MLASEPRVGSRVQRLRRGKRISQADLAVALGISASYLNLIEHNRRRITVPLLMKLAGYFGIEPGELVENDESRLVGDLMELFGDELFAESGLTSQDVRDLAASNPSAGRAVVRLFDQYRALRDARQRGEVDLGGGEGGEFHPATDAVSDFIQENANYFPTLEEAAERVRRDIDAAADSYDSFEYGLRTYLFNVFGLQWRTAALPAGVARRYDAERRELITADTQAPETATFAVAHQLGLMAAASQIDALIASGSFSADAPVLMRNALASYFAAALLMPYEPFLKACRETRYDIERIERRFRVSFEQVCHRMTTLQKPGASGIPLHLVRTDIAGNISKRFSLSGIRISRHSGACPRWNVYSAFLSPERINVQISQMPEGQRYFCIARSITKGGHRHHAPRRHLSIGLGCHIAHAPAMVYSDGMNLSDIAQAVPIGVGCRICPRMDCEQRAHPPSDYRFTLDVTDMAESIYAQARPV